MRKKYIYVLPGVNTIQHSISDLLIVVLITESYARLLYTIPVSVHPKLCYNVQTKCQNHNRAL